MHESGLAVMAVGSCGQSADVCDIWIKAGLGAHGEAWLMLYQVNAKACCGGDEDLHGVRPFRDHSVNNCDEKICVYRDILAWLSIVGSRGPVGNKGPGRAHSLGR